MLKLHTIKPAIGSRHRRKIVGRGEGSGHGGKGSTRGFKGQTARSGDASMRPGFEGGQIPLVRRIPKRGFNNFNFRTEYIPVNVADLEALFDKGGEVSAETLRSAGIIRAKGLIKILGDGDLTKALTVKVNAVSKSAREKIEKAGGRVELIVRKPGKTWKPVKPSKKPAKPAKSV